MSTVVLTALKSSLGIQKLKSNEMGQTVKKGREGAKEEERASHFCFCAIIVCLCLSVWLNICLLVSSVILFNSLYTHHYDSRASVLNRQCSPRTFRHMLVGGFAPWSQNTDYCGAFITRLRSHLLRHHMTRQDKGTSATNTLRQDCPDTSGFPDKASQAISVHP